jgi:hypothetical protein
MKTEEKLVTVARYDSYVNADLARQVLEEQGIKAAVMGQNVGNVYSGVPAAIDIEVQTFESQAEEARRILDEAKLQAVDETYQAGDEEWSEDDDLAEDEGREQG